MKSLFGGSTCVTCGGKIAKGEEIVNKHGNWVHHTCRPVAKPVVVAKPAVEVKPVVAVAKPLAKPAGEHRHPKFQQVLDHLSLREQVMLTGPAGCGKTHLVNGVAKAMGLRFGMVSGSGGVTETSLFGSRDFVDGSQVWLDAEFLSVYETGGVYLFDELDGFDPNVLLSVNSALANGYTSVAKRFNRPRAERHADFYCCATANTAGRGASRSFCGRNPLDAATLSRFTVIEMDYDMEFERLACPDAQLLRRLWQYRRNCADARLERTIGTRDIQKAFNWVSKLGKDVKYVESILFAGWRADEVAKATSV